jgi:hypothetical protein
MMSMEGDVVLYECRCEVETMVITLLPSNLYVLVTSFAHGVNQGLRLKGSFVLIVCAKVNKTVGYSSGFSNYDAAVKIFACL